MIDTLAVSERLIEAGMDRKQAEAVAHQFYATSEASSTAHATKADLENLRSATKSDLNVLKSDLTLAIEKVKNDTIKWQIGVGFTVFAALVGTLKLMMTH